MYRKVIIYEYRSVLLSYYYFKEHCFTVIMLYSVLMFQLKVQVQIPAHCLNYTHQHSFWEKEQTVVNAESQMQRALLHERYIQNFK